MCLLTSSATPESLLAEFPQERQIVLERFGKKPLRDIESLCLNSADACRLALSD
jgi:hypothetical protein